MNTLRIKSNLTRVVESVGFEFETIGDPDEKGIIFSQIKVVGFPGRKLAGQVIRLRAEVKSWAAKEPDIGSAEVISEVVGIVAIVGIIVHLDKDKSEALKLGK